MPCLRHCANLLVALSLTCGINFLSAQSFSSSPTPAVDAPSTLLPASSTSVTVYATHDPIPQAVIHAEAERELKLEETQRIAVVVPNFNTVLSGEGVPLDRTQKLRLAWRATEDPFNIVGSFVFAGASEIKGTERGFGWGPSGYFKRTGANYADVADGTMLAGAVYPILLHQDPRYFRQGTGSFRSRLRHALLAPYLCRGDNGRTQPNLSNILGNFTAGAISNAYYPSSQRGASLTLVNASTVTVEGSLGNIGLEFAPDVSSYLHRRRSSHTSAYTPSAPPSDISTVQ